MDKAKKLAELEAEIEQDLMENTDDGAANVEAAFKSNDVVDYKDGDIKPEQAADPPEKLSRVSLSITKSWMSDE